MSSTVNPINWSPGVTLAQIEQQVILAAYAFYRHNKSATSRSLDISVRTLDQRLQKYGQDSETLAVEERARRDKQRLELERRRRGGAAPAPVPVSVTTVIVKEG